MADLPTRILYSGIAKYFFFLEWIGPCNHSFLFSRRFETLYNFISFHLLFILSSSTSSSSQPSLPCFAPSFINNTRSNHHFLIPSLLSFLSLFSFSFFHFLSCDALSPINALPIHREERCQSCYPYRSLPSILILIALSLPFLSPERYLGSDGVITTSSPLELRPTPTTRDSRSPFRRILK